MASKRKSNCRRVDGISYVELVIGLSIAVMVFLPSYRFASILASRVLSERDADAELDSALATLARDLRSASDGAPGIPFHLDPAGCRLTFATASARSLERVVYSFCPENGHGRMLRNEEILCRDIKAGRLRFFDGSGWISAWGWNDEKSGPSEHRRGLPLAVGIEISGNSGAPRRLAVPVMTAVLNRWGP